MLDATRLRVLVAIARHGSVTAAAQALNYAQPSISHHMARLEAETGAKLMERVGRGVRLTEAGQLLAERAEEILGRLDAAEAELAAHVGLRPGRVRLAAFGTALATIAAAAATTMAAEQAGTELQLAQAEPAEAIRMLRAGEADVALTYQYAIGDEDLAGLAGSHGDDDLRVALLLDEPVYLLGHGAGPAPAAGGPRRRPADPAGLARCRWIAWPEGPAEVLERLSRPGGSGSQVAVRAGDYATAQALAMAGLGVAVLPGLALRAMARHDAVSTELRGVRRHIFAVTFGAPPQAEVTERLVAALHRAAAAPLPAQQARARSPLPGPPSTGRAAGA